MSSLLSNVPVDGDGTLLTLTHQEILDDTVHDYRRGWIGALDKLEKLLA